MIGVDVRRDAIADLDGSLSCCHPSRPDHDEQHVRVLVHEQGTSTEMSSAHLQERHCSGDMLVQIGVNAHDDLVWILLPLLARLLGGSCKRPYRLIVLWSDHLLRRFRRYWRYCGRECPG